MEETLPESPIQFFVEGLEYTWAAEPQLAAWISNTLQAEQKEAGAINVILCSDEYLHRMNVQYLDHDTLTDVITFPYRSKPIEGDIFISLDRIRDNAAGLGLLPQQELHRVVIHGVLHLCGYEDKTPAAKARMTGLEDKYLRLLPQLPASF